MQIYNANGLLRGRRGRAEGRAAVRIGLSSPASFIICNWDHPSSAERRGRGCAGFISAAKTL